MTYGSTDRGRTAIRHRALVGLVLHENKPMLKMCRKLGFSIAPEPNDATVLRVRKSLAPV